MQDLFRRWFGGAGGTQWRDVAAWADSAGHRFTRSRDGSGFIIQSGQDAAAWRLEWGPPQRHYFSSPELRLRGEVGPTADLQMLIVTRPLMTKLEHEVFEEFTEHNQTRMDDGTPEEMRWLVLYPKVPRAELGPLRERFGALSNVPRAALRWVGAPLMSQLDASSAWLGAEQPLLLVLQRGRLTLRCAQAQPELPVLQGALGLFGVALAAARRVGEELARGEIGDDRPSSWGAPSRMPAAEPKEG